MCGIVGYVGHKQALEIVVAGLRRMEYRGYDSAGVAVIADGGLEVRKKAGKLGNLEQLLGEDPLSSSTTGIGHTRWATHGGPTDRNAHPHVSSDDRIAVIHNGIIENFHTLRTELEGAGVQLESETDTEVVALRISKDDFSTLLDSVPGLARAILETVTWVYRYAESRLPVATKIPMDDVGQVSRVEQSRSDEQEPT